MSLFKGKIYSLDKEETFSSVTDYSDYRANLVCAVSMILIAVGITVNLILAATGSLYYIYVRAENILLITSALFYVIPVAVAGLGKFRLPFHKHLLLGGMIGGSAVLYSAIAKDGGAFILFPMFVAGIYYSEDMCVKTYLHLLVISVIDVIAFFALDISQFHYYGLSWDITHMLFNFIMPEILYLTVVFFFSMYTMRHGRRITSQLIDSTEKSAKRKAEMETCAKVQKSALPSDFSLAPDGEFSVSAGIRPAYETAGDFYDMFVTEDGRLVALVADVSDKGLASALYMMSVRNTVRSMFSFTDNLEEIFRKMNAILCDTSDMEFVTMFLVCLDIRTGSGKYLNAGHNPPLFRRGDGTVSLLESEPQVFLGAFSGADYSSSDIVLGKGDILCLYTDGIPDSLNSDREEFGTERMADVIKAYADCEPDEICSKILDGAEAFSDSGLFTDDKTLVVLKWN